MNECLSWNPSACSRPFSPAAPAAIERRGHCFRTHMNSRVHLWLVLLLPLAAAGVSVEKLLSGARWMEGTFRETKGEKNPVLLAASGVPSAPM